MFRTATGIQSGPDAFDESRFIMNFLTILGVTEKLCSFRLVLARKTGKRYREDNTSGPLNRGGIADLPLLRTLLAIRQKSWEQNFWEVMDSFVLWAYASLAASRTLLHQLLACLNFTLHSENFFCWYKRKKKISMNYGSSTGSWKSWSWVRLDLIVTMQVIYINSNLNPLTKFIISNRSRV